MLLLPHLCFTVELWYRHIRNSVIREMTTHTIGMVSCVSSATVSVKQGDVRFHIFHINYKSW